ncbi:hypothetical protein L0222_13280 [bacterium]|nr:hypothetical protein [bacterium]MCI0603018.1 hypothetical protein [bacterium]
MLSPHQKVFGIGLSKTGTASLGRALNLLRVKTIHCPSDNATLSELKSGNYKLSILNRFQGVVDTPVVPFYPQLDQEFPGSKFILTIREIDSWIESMRHHLSFVSRWSNGSLPFFAFIDACVYGTLQFHEGRLRYVYERHLGNVTDYFSDRPSDLLILNICGGEGWEKLCPFLGLPAPSKRFPKLNRSRRNQWISPPEVEAAIQRIHDLLPSGARFAVAGYNKLFLDIPGAMDLPLPATDEDAMEQLHELKQNGVKYFILLSPFFWWLEHYVEFHDSLKRDFRTVVQDAHLVIFQLN